MAHAIFETEPNLVKLGQQIITYSHELQDQDQVRAVVAKLSK